MFDPLRSNAKRHPILTALFAISVALTLYFGARLVLHTIYWADPAHQDQTIAGWMTPGYVAHSWNVPPILVGEALGFTKETIVRGQTLEELARARGLSVEDLSQTLYDAIAEFRAYGAPNHD